MVPIHHTGIERTDEDLPEVAFCLYCYSEMVRILDENVWRCVNEMCALYMKDQFGGETHD